MADPAPQSPGILAQLASLLRSPPAPQQPQLGMQPSPGMLGQGMAAQAGSAPGLMNAYRQYVTDTSSNGGDPVDFGTWATQQH